MLKIGIDISSLLSSTRTGVGEYTYELLNAIFNIDNENQYFLFYNSFKDVSQNIPKWKNKNVQIVKTSWPNKLFHLFVQTFRYPKIDLVLFKKTGEKLDYFFSPNIGFQAISRGTKHILTVHDLSFEILPECFSVKMRLWHTFLFPARQCKRADIIFTPSENTKRDIVDLYAISKDKIKVLTPGISSLFTSSSNDKNTQTLITKKYNVAEKYILFLGTLEPRKNIEGLLQAFQVFQKDFPEYHLVIAGASGWKNKYILDAIEKTPNVQYIGYVLNEDKPVLYAGASIFVYPSLYEGFGFPILEAFASGTAVITSARSSLPEVADDAAYYINPLNSFEIVEGLKQLLSNQDLNNFFIKKGLLQIQKFHWQKTAEQFLSSL